MWCRLNLAHNILWFGEFILSTNQDNPAAPGAPATDPGLAVLGLLLNFGGGLAEKVIEVEGDKVKTAQGNTYSLAEALALAAALQPPAPPAPPTPDYTPALVIGGVGVLLFLALMFGGKR